jgi:YggT family protein
MPAPSNSIGARDLKMILHEIAQLILGTIASLLGGVLALRAYLAWLRMSRSNPMVLFCAAFTDWMIAPVRRVFPLTGRVDWASWACLLAVAAASLALRELLGAGSLPGWQFFLPGVIALMLHWILDLLLLVVFAYVLLSLVNPHAPLAPTFEALTRPVLAPFRRIVPPMGGFDLSPTALILVIVVLRYVLDRTGL